MLLSCYTGCTGYDTFLYSLVAHVGFLQVTVCAFTDVGIFLESETVSSVYVKLQNTVYAKNHKANDDTHRLVQWVEGGVLVTPGVYNTVCDVFPHNCVFITCSAAHHRTKMTTAAAAAALSRSRGVAGVGTKGLFFVFTLLCLVCLSSSLIDKNQVKQLVETYQNAQQDLNKVKAEYMSKVSTTSDLMKDSMDIMESMKAWMKTLVSAAPGVFPPVGKYMESMHDYMQKTKDEVDGENEALLAKIKRSEEELGKMKKLIQALEEYQAEL